MAQAVERETADDPGVGARLAPVHIELARGLARLDELCWSIRFDVNMELPRDNTHLIVRYDTGGVQGAGQQFVAQTGRAEVLKAMGRFQDALDAYDAVRQDHPENVVAQTGNCTNNVYRPIDPEQSAPFDSYKY